MDKFDLTRLKYQLEEIEKVYFIENKPIVDKINDDIKSIDAISKFKQGDICAVKVDSPLPVYILILKRCEFYFECVRVSIFTEFESDLDIIFEAWLIQPWNKLKILFNRISHKVESVPEELITQIYSMMGKLKDKKEPVLLQHFRDLEVAYQNDYFLNSDNEIIEKLINEKSNLLKSIKQKLTEQYGKIINIVLPEQLPLFADTGKLVTYGYEKSILIYEDDVIRLSYFLYRCDESFCIKFFLNHFLNIIVDNIFINNSGADILFEDFEKTIFQYRADKLEEVIINLNILNNELKFCLKQNA
ncbi:hypothetical protein LF845_06555 [Deferribacterales bacterium Es71-Z0220]|jgi:hypothetical protein|uniref:hypothetical protein n=1 Tax=Deferrivibrio essentukiensis TaxID=2880922 RepID=UPI001F60DCB1|nr:hypothetical protein [Deferrivibrio essentukiensis]MCB4204618.1 hypothetical protein [Deferrivibrio essentukiensis]